MTTTGDPKYTKGYVSCEPNEANNLGRVTVKDPGSSFHRQSFKIRSVRGGCSELVVRGANVQFVLGSQDDKRGSPMGVAFDVCPISLDESSQTRSAGCMIKVQ